MVSPFTIATMTTLLQAAPWLGWTNSFLPLAFLLPLTLLHVSYTEQVEESFQKLSPIMPLLAQTLAVVSQPIEREI